MTYTVIKQAGRECPWCDKAVQLLEASGVAYTVDSLDREPLVDQALKAGMTTVPIIYRDDTLIGGFTDLVAHLAKPSDDEVPE